MASSEAEDAAVATTNGISLAPDNLEEEVAHLMAQELPYTVFDTDTEVAVASMLNAKLEFDEALLTENVALHCGTAGLRGEVEGIAQDVEMQEVNQENDSENEDSSHYLKFSRTVVCDTAGSSDTTGQPASAQSISQLDGADGGSESDESESVDGEAQDTDGENGEIGILTSNETPTKQLTVNLKRLESIYSVSNSAVEQRTAEPDYQEKISSPEVLESSYASSDMVFQEEVVQTNSEVPTSQDDIYLDSTTGHFVSSELAVPPNSILEDKEESSSSTDSAGTFKDDLNDPDYSPEEETKKSPTAPMKRFVVNAKRPPLHFSRFSPKPILPQLHKIKLQLQPRPAQIVNSVSPSPAAATLCTTPRTVTSPIVINGLSALPIQPGATRGRAIAIRVDNSKPGVQHHVMLQNQAAATTSSPPSTPAPQVLLVNRQGQILIKDPRSNIYQSLSSNSPAYNKISQIAKMLHSGNALPRSIPRVIIKPRSGPSAANAQPAPNHTMGTEKKIIIRVLPVNSSGTPGPNAPAAVQTVPETSISHIKESTAQAIIERAMATHRDAPKVMPIILRKTEKPKAQHQNLPKFQDTEDSNLSPEASLEAPGGFRKEPDAEWQPSPASLRQQVRVKRVSSVSARIPRKKSKMDFLKDPSNELDEVRYSKI